METPWREVIEKTCPEVWILNPQDRTIYVNDRFGRSLDLDSAEIIHPTPADIIDLEQSLRLLSCLKQRQPVLADLFSPSGRALSLTAFYHEQFGRPGWHVTGNADNGGRC